MFFWAFLPLDEWIGAILYLSIPGLMIIPLVAFYYYLRPNIENYTPHQFFQLHQQYGIPANRWRALAHSPVRGVVWDHPSWRRDRCKLAFTPDGLLLRVRDISLSAPPKMLLRLPVKRLEPGEASSCFGFFDAYQFGIDPEKIYRKWSVENSLLTFYLPEDSDTNRRLLAAIEHGENRDA